jgi:hypothetical protein
MWMEELSNEARARAHNFSPLRYEGSATRFLWPDRAALRFRRDERHVLGGSHGLATCLKSFGPSAAAVDERALSGTSEDALHSLEKLADGGADGFRFKRKPPGHIAMPRALGLDPSNISIVWAMGGSCASNWVGPTKRRAHRRVLVWPDRPSIGGRMHRMQPTYLQLAIGYKSRGGRQSPDEPFKVPMRPCLCVPTCLMIGRRHVPAGNR